ncbi:BMP family lipoprotein [Clostridium sp. 'White wine YQ']|uniref:BMP family lipoprotein n=1 Tax=Clostridium sp. 'White wine YQ' TaxID=3027474 RepID=UPI0023664634|nr:BMP family ABC transporter substrate-binding protein [Clostridium sp. 'White wine YQ']MDD7795251.1 BMP family ABC transporter substrate-binding protein [Clostridium sp. 'White wine YQ']
MNKKLIASISAIAVVATLFAGCAKKDDSTTKTTKEIKVGLSTDEGGLNDKSFNQSADAGIKKAQTDLKVGYKAVESKTKDDYESNLDALVADGSDLVFGIGFQMETALGNVADKYSDKKFAIVDTVVNKPNVVSYTFKEQEGSFLMGVIAGKTTKTNKVGFIGGKDEALINKFEAGFVAGVESVNPTAAADLLNRKNVAYVNSFADAALGKQAAQNLINSGCDVIYHAAGGVGVGMFQAIQEANKAGNKVWGIGVDMDQAQTLPQYADIILSSMIKRVDTATYEATKSVVDDKFQGGKNVVLGIKEGAIGIAETSSKNTSKDVLDLVQKYQDAIKDGKITAPSTIDELKAFKPVEVK